MKITTIISLVGIFGAFVFGGILFSNSNEQLQETRDDLYESNMEFDSLIRKDIQFFSSMEHPDAYDTMMEWKQACDTRERWNEIPACNDGSIEEYLKTLD